MSEIKVNQVNPRVASGTVTFGASGDSLSIPSGVTLTVASGATITNNGTASGFGMFASYAIISDEKAQGTAGGTATSGSWETRDLNTEDADPDAIVSIASNQFTLQSGTYWIEWSANAYRVDGHQTRLYNATDTSVAEIGTMEDADAASDTTTRSFGSARVTIASSKAFEIQHRVQTTRATDGHGTAPSWGDGTAVKHTVVKIFKEE